MNMRDLEAKFDAEIAKLKATVYQLKQRIDAIEAGQNAVGEIASPDSDTE